MITKKYLSQQVEIFENNSSKNINEKYLIFLPKNFNSDNAVYPLMLFLHGAGERGTDIELVKKHGPPKIVENDPSLPFIIVSPQCKPGKRWIPADIKAILDEILLKYKVDISRIYLTGLSMGGFGTWETAIEYPDLFAAAAPICGGGNPEQACKIKNLPVWVFHGAKDNVVPVEKSLKMVRALKDCGGHPKFTVYPEAVHDSWTQTYNNQELYEWFLAQRKN